MTDSIITTPSPREGNAARCWFAGLLVLMAFVLGCTRLRTADLWWHLKTGELILERGVPQTDWFTYTSEDRDWIDLHWGFQVIIVLLNRVAGLWALSLFKGMCLAVTIALAWGSSSREISPVLKALLWYCPVMVLAGRTMIRPELITFLLLSAFLFVLHHANQHPKWLWVLPGLQVVWVNCHGLFILGPLVLGLWLFDHAVTATGWWQQRQQTELLPLRLSWKTRTGLLVAVCGACLINPYFLKGALFPLVLFRKLSVDQTVYATQVLEFFPTIRVLQNLNLSVLEHRWILGLLVLPVLSFLLIWSQRRFSLFRLLLFVAFAYLGSKMVRNLALYALVSGVIQVQNFQEFFIARRERIPESKRMPMGITLPFACAGSVALLLTILWGMNGQFSLRTNRFFRFGLGEYPGVYIQKETEFAGRPGMPATAFIASFGDASMYLYHHGPAHRVFLDGRLEVASVETFQTYVQVKRFLAAGDPAFEALVVDDQGQLPCLILSHLGGQSKLVNGANRLPGWRPVFVGPLSVIFLEEATAEELDLPRVTFPWEQKKSPGDSQ